MMAHAVGRGVRLLGGKEIFFNKKMGKALVIKVLNFPALEPCKVRGLPIPEALSWQV